MKSILAGIVFFMGATSSSFAGGVASLNNVLEWLDAFSFKNDGTVLVDLDQSWNLKADDNGVTYSHRPHGGDSPFARANQVRVDYDKSRKIQQVTQATAGEASLGGNSATIKGDGIYSFTTCIVDCHTVTKALCDSIQTQLGAKSYQQMIEKLRACDDAAQIKIPSKVLDNAMAAEAPNRAAIEKLSGKKFQNSLLQNLDPVLDPAKTKVGTVYAVAYRCDRLQFSAANTASNTGSTIQFNQKSQSTSPAR